MRARDYARQVASLRDVPSRVTAAVAEAIQKKLQNQFDTGTDPYGNGYAALASGGPSHLDDTGSMRAGTTATPASDSVIALTSPSPAEFHQSGTSRMPQRKVLPDLAVPSSWREEMRDQFGVEIRKALGK